MRNKLKFASAKLKNKSGLQPRMLLVKPFCYNAVEYFYTQRKLIYSYTCGCRKVIRFHRIFFFIAQDSTNQLIKFYLKYKTII